jgi:hypothetical protein
MKLSQSIATAAAAVVAFALSASAYAQTYMGKAEVRTVRGDAFYSTGPGTPLMPLKNGTVLGPGATLKTGKGGAVDLFLGRSAGTIRVTEDTTVTFDKFTITDTGADTVVDVQLNLPEGTILGNVNKLSAASKYEVKLPNGVAGVRGTEYRMSSTGYIVVLNGTVIFVYVPPGGQPTPYTLIGPPAMYFSPIEGVRPAPEDLVVEVRNQLGRPGFRPPGPPPAVPFHEPFVSPGTGAKPENPGAPGRGRGNN